jgi:hypothetical protein
LSQMLSDDRIDTIENLIAESLNEESNPPKVDFSADCMR